MSEVGLMVLAETGRRISMAFVAAIYIILWLISLNVYRDKNNDSELLESFSIFWVGIHCFAFLSFLIWSWTY